MQRKESIASPWIERICREEEIIRKSALTDTAEALQLTRAVFAGIIEQTSPSLSCCIQKHIPSFLKEIWIEALYHYELESKALETFRPEVEHYTGLEDRESIDEGAKIVLESLISDICSHDVETIIPWIPEEYRISIEPRISKEMHPLRLDETIDIIYAQEPLPSQFDAQVLVKGILHALKLQMGKWKSELVEMLPEDWEELWDDA